MNFMDQSTIGASRESEPAALSTMGIAFPGEVDSDTEVCQECDSTGSVEELQLQGGKISAGPIQPLSTPGH